MDIHKLTVTGFKSFYEKSVFTFGKNITAIVGPNGSGKSNITEAIRFVLGEQSTKSMRGKDVADLLFRGNSVRASKARVEIEFVKAKGAKGKLGKGNTENIFIKNLLEKDEVSIARTVFQDGKSIYEMNGVEVRLKDVHEFLLYIHLGNKSSWHISQGEADKVLLANSSERKTIIEDALGLKVYHARINDASKKLIKTKENIREATLKRKEILPEINMLERQVEKIRRSEEFRGELAKKGSIYLGYKKEVLENFRKNLGGKDSLSDLKKQEAKLEERISGMQTELYKNKDHDVSFFETELEKETKVLSHLNTEVDKINSEKRDIENNLTYSKLEEEKYFTELLSVEKEISSISKIGNDVVFQERDVQGLAGEIEEQVKEINKSNDLSLVREIAERINYSFKSLISKGSIVNKDNLKQITYLQGIRSRVQEKMQALKKDIEGLDKKINHLNPTLEKENLKVKLSTERVETLKKEILEFKFMKSEAEKNLQALIFERESLVGKIAQSESNKERLDSMEHEFRLEQNEFENILGRNFEVKGEQQKIGSEEELQTLSRSIEKLKIRLEESMVGNSQEVTDSYTQMKERDAFLLKEITDLESSMANLEDLILDLQTSLKKDFELGLKHIGHVFDTYVKKLFGGGGAKVFLIEIEPRKKNILEDEQVESEEEELKTGVEVEVEIPKKKVKGLHSLSGGERALVSIALNFSIINENPAPFMILDETDATLDEANAKRYGEILSILKENTKLIVVTHNRETMHFADQVYGVTLAQAGHSKVLSVSFEDAIEYAK